MLPIYLLSAVKGEPVMVELKRGETVNGVLTNCDSWMNITLKDVVVCDAHGDNFHKLDFIYLKGVHIKYITMSNDLIEKFREQQLRDKEHYHHRDRSGNGSGGYGNNRRGGYNRRNFNHNNGNGPRYGPRGSRN